MVLTICDRYGTRSAMVSPFEYSASTADGVETFTVKLPIGMYGLVPENGMAYFDGTEWGGTVDDRGVDYSGKTAKAVFSGRTWRGILARRVVVPDGDHYRAQGDANEAIAALLEHSGVGFPFVAEPSPAGVEVDCELPRFCTVLDGLGAMLSSAGLDLSLRRERGFVRLSAAESPRPLRLTPASCRFTATVRSRPVNHFVCVGVGESEERAVVHLYADESGTVSQTQSLFGIDEVAETYEYTTADEAQLAEDGAKRLQEYQQFIDARAQAPDGISLSLGAPVVIADPESGLSIEARVDDRSAKSSGDAIKESYEFGDYARGKARLWP